MAEATLINNRVLPDAKAENDAFFQGLGDGSLSTAFNIAKGIDAGVETATKINTFIDEFGPAGQEKKRVALDAQKADLSVKQSQAVLAELKKRSVMENEDLILQTEREKLNREAYQGKLAGQLSKTSSEFYERLQQVPVGDYEGYSRVRFDPKYSILAKDPEFRKAVRQSDAIYGAAAAQSGTPEGERISRALIDLDTTSSPSTTLRGQDLKEAELGIRQQAVDVQRQRAASGLGSKGGAPKLSNKDLGLIGTATGQSDSLAALSDLVAAEIEVRGPESAPEQFITLPNGRSYGQYQDPKNFDALMAGKGYATRVLQTQRNPVVQPPVGQPTPQQPVAPQQSLPPQQQLADPAPQQLPQAQPLEQQSQPIVAPDPQTGLVSTPSNVNALAQRIGVELPEGSDARKGVSEVLSMVDELEVDPDGSFLDSNASVGRIPRLKLLKASESVAKRVAKEQSSQITDEQLAAQMALRDGDTPSSGQVDRERRSRERALSNKITADLINAAETARLEKQSTLRRAQQRLKVREANSETALRIAEVRQIPVEEVERRVAESVAKLKQLRPELSNEAAETQVLKIMKSRILGS